MEDTQRKKEQLAPNEQVMRQTPDMGSMADSPQVTPQMTSLAEKPISAASQMIEDEEEISVVPSASTPAQTSKLRRVNSVSSYGSEEVAVPYGLKPEEI